MLFRKEEKSQETFWQEYEEQTGEKVLERGLGKYISGWDEFDENRVKDIWGLVITTSGGFRFHHFPQYNWLDSFSAAARKGEKKERTLFVPHEKIIAVELKKETKWWKKLISPPPQLVIIYADGSGQEKKMIFEAEFTSSPGN